MDATELRSLTYSRGDLYDRTIDTEDLQHDCPLDQTSSKTLSASHMQDATASLGLFDKLPLETMQDILSNIDLSTLTLLRSISKPMNHVVNSLPDYKKVVTHSPDALRALLSTHTAQYFTVIDLYNALRAQRCFLCCRFGAFLYLLNCRRCCWHCLTSVDDLLPISQASAKLLYRFEEQTTARVPMLLNIPGSYSLKQSRSSHPKSKGGIRVALVAYGAARKACKELQDGAAVIDKLTKAKQETRIAFRGPFAQDYMEDMDCMNYDPAGYNAGYGLQPQRFMAAVRFPTLINRTDATVEWGVSCLGCLEEATSGDEEQFWNRQYTNEDMVKHLKHCDKARHSWFKDRMKELHNR